MLLALQLNMLLEDEAAPDPGTWEQAATVAGFAVSDDGTIGTAYLSDVEPVPGSAHFLGALAFSTAGLLYVASWPGDDDVEYVRGLAVRPDGALVIVDSGTTQASVAGWAVTARGEVLATTATPDVIHQGIGQIGSTGAVCMSEIS